MKDGFMTPAEVSQLIGVTVETLKNWRWQGKGLPYYKLNGKSVSYKKTDVLCYIDSSKVEVPR